MAAFFTKKQKAEYRKRKKRVKHAVKTDPSKKQVDDKKKEEPKEDSPEADKATENPTHGQKENDNVVIVPKDLSAQDAKKFRKDARRKARKAGKDASLLEFVVEGSENEKSKQGNNKNAEQVTNGVSQNTNKKKRKREFPCLNELVKQQEEAKQKKEQEESRKQSEENLSEEYKARYLALDCEMVGIGTDGKKSVLARVSMVDWDGNVVIDSFVQVPTRVTDFRTHVSGVTAKDIKVGAMKESECREKVAALMKGKVVVGHALKNDFDALMLTHPKEDIRDTAKYRPFQRLGGRKWRPRKLRDLVKENLGLSIQQPGQAHDSTEDASATMNLFRLVREEWERELEEKSSKKKAKTA